MKRFEPERAPLFWLGIAAAVGIGVSLGPEPHGPGERWLIVSLITLVFLLLCRRRPWWREVAACLAIASAFALWSEVRVRRLPPDHWSHRFPDGFSNGIWRVVVDDFPEFSQEEVRATVRLLWLWDEPSRQWISSSGRVMLTWADPPEQLRPGDYLEIHAHLRRPGPARNPGEVNYATFLWTRNICAVGQITGDAGQLISRGHTPPWMQLATDLRTAMLDRLSIGLETDPQTTGLMSGMLFGYRHGISDELMEAFRVTGTLHLFAVSGQNVMLVVFLLVYVLQTLGLVRARWAWLAAGPVCIFCLASGMEASASRALVMVLLFMGAQLLSRPVQPFNILGAAALTLWLIDPRQLFDIGFQLSFLVVAALCALVPPIYQRIGGWAEPDPFLPPSLVPEWRRLLAVWGRGVALIFAASLAAWIGSLPLSLIYFNLFGPITLLANVLVSALAAAVLILAALSVLSGWIWLGFSAILNQANWLILLMMSQLVTVLAAVPMGHWLISLQDPWPSGSYPRMLVVDGAQSTPVVVMTGTQTWVINPGTERTYHHQLRGALRVHEVNRVEGWILTQATSRAAGSVPAILRDHPNSSWWSLNDSARSRVWRLARDLLQKKPGPPRTLLAGESWQAGDKVTFRVLWPSADASIMEPFTRAEDRGAVIHVRWEQASALLAGGISAAVEQVLLQTEADLQAEVLVQEPHPVARNLSLPWLEAVRPQAIFRPRGRIGYDHSLTADLHAFVEQHQIAWFSMEDTGALFYDGVQIKSWLEP